MEESVRKETQQAMTLVAPGPHAILLLVPVNQFTEVGSNLFLPMGLPFVIKALSALIFHYDYY